MRQILLAVYSLVLFITPASAQVNMKIANRFANEITELDLSKHLHIVAGPEMQGRETGTVGERLASEYLISQVKQLGLQPGFKNDYLMPFPLFRDSIVQSKLVINGQTYLGGQAFLPLASNYSHQFWLSDISLISSSEPAAFSNLTVLKGRAVMLIFGENESARTVSSKLAALAKSGVAVVFAVCDSAQQTAVLKLGKNISKNYYPESLSAPVYLINKPLAESLLQRPLANLDIQNQPLTVSLELEVQTEKIRIPVTANNVIAVLEGTTKKEEYLVLTAHYDHLGIQNNQIHYGADDDGSGTVALLEIAKAFAQAKQQGKGPARTLVFLWVSGEEKGLWGSAFYAKHPVVALSKTTADLNIDMIGRTDTVYAVNEKKSRYVYTVGNHKVSSDFQPIIQTANQKLKLQLDERYNDPADRSRIFERSDHYNFAINGVPALFLFGGIHNDYHRPTDTVDKIDFELMSLRTRLAFLIAWQMANRPDLMKRDKPLKN